MSRLKPFYSFQPTHNLGWYARDAMNVRRCGRCKRQKTKRSRLFYCARCYDLVVWFVKHRIVKPRARVRSAAALQARRLAAMTR